MCCRPRDGGGGRSGAAIHVSWQLAAVWLVASCRLPTRFLAYEQSLANDGCTRGTEGAIVCILERVESFIRPFHVLCSVCS